jgi:hypothetical protein
MYAKSDKGFMTLQLFEIILKKVIELMKNEGRGDLPVLIYADRAKCHESVDLIKYLYDQNVHIIWFISNSSQITQPLDGAPYANLKKKLKSAIDDEVLRRTILGESTKQVVAELVPIVEREAFTPEVWLLCVLLLLLLLLLLFDF